MVSIAVFESCCATKAQTPKPAYARLMPRKAEKMVPPIVEKKNLLNSIFLETYACCIPLTPDSLKKYVNALIKLFSP